MRATVEEALRRAVDQIADELRGTSSGPRPPDIFERGLTLQHDLAHHHGLWHRT